MALRRTVAVETLGELDVDRQLVKPLDPITTEE